MALISLFLSQYCFFSTLWLFWHKFGFFGANLLSWHKYCFFWMPILFVFLVQILLFWCIFNFSSQKYTILMLNKPLSCLNAFFGANIVFYAKIARLFWNNKIILLYHSKVREKEIIPLDLSHKQKLVLNFQARALWVVCITRDSCIQLHLWLEI